MIQLFYQLSSIHSFNKKKLSAAFEKFKMAAAQRKGQQNTSFTMILNLVAVILWTSAGGNVVQEKQQAALKNLFSVKRIQVIAVFT